jgi:hypothetical protein
LADRRAWARRRRDASRRLGSFAEMDNETSRTNMQVKRMAPQEIYIQRKVKTHLRRDVADEISSWMMAEIVVKKSRLTNVVFLVKKTGERSVWSKKKRLPAGDKKGHL